METLPPFREYAEYPYPPYFVTDRENPAIDLSEKISMIGIIYGGRAHLLTFF